MPSVLIETRRPYAVDTEAAIIEAVHAALRDAFKIKACDRTVRIIVREPQRFACPPGLAQPEAFTYVSIDAIAGRSMEAKRKLYRSIVNNLGPLGIPKDHVQVLLRESPPDNWGVCGSQAAGDVDLGHKIDV